MRARVGSSACSPPTRLLAAGRLAQENDTADAVLWATGSVRPVDLTVGAVSHVPEKLANSLDRLKQERAAGRRMLLAVPAANAAEVPPELAGELSADGFEIDRAGACSIAVRCAGDATAGQPRQGNRQDY